jgi:hypothetical protein
MKGPALPGRGVADEGVQRVPVEGGLGRAVGALDRGERARDAGRGYRAAARSARSVIFRVVMTSCPLCRVCLCLRAPEWVIARLLVRFLPGSAG